MKIIWALRKVIKRMGHQRLGLTVVEYCDRCGRRQPLIWWSDDDLWLLLNHGVHAGAYCPECFDGLAAERGLLLRWKPECHPATPISARIDHAR